MHANQILVRIEVHYVKPLYCNNNNNKTNTDITVYISNFKTKWIREKNKTAITAIVIKSIISSRK